MSMNILLIIILISANTCTTKEHVVNVKDFLDYLDSDRHQIVLNKNALEKLLYGKNPIRVSNRQI